MKRVYIVRGSEDGTLGVYSNQKAALQHAISYCGGAGFVEVVKHKWNISVYGNFSADVEIFHLDKEFIE